jgi:purine-binding chemotaxis protein CheW
MGSRMLLTFNLREDSYGAPIAAVREILEVPALAVVPLMSALIRGVISLRGAVVPVIDLAVRFGFEPAVLSPRSCVVVVEAPGDDDGPSQVVGLLVDGVSRVVEVNDSDLEPPPDLGTRIDPTYVSAMAKLSGGLMVVLDLDRVLAIDALTRLAHEGVAAEVA